MKNFKQEKCKQNRNYLRYFISNTFEEHPFLTIKKIIKDKVFIKNKDEYHTAEKSKLFYEFKLANKTGFIMVSVTKDHLINAKVSYKKSKEIKTRDISEVVSLIEEVLFT